MGRYEDAVLALAPTGYWPCTEAHGTTAYDLAPTPHEGSYSGTPTRAAPGPGPSLPYAMRTAANGSQTQFVTAGNLTAFNVVANTFTTAIWLRLRSLGAAGTNGLIARGQSPDSFSDRTFSLQVAAGPLAQIRIFAVSARSTVGATPIALGSWYLVAGTYDGASLRVYLNGCLDGSGAFSDSVNNPNSRSLLLGALQNLASANPDYDVAHAAYWRATALGEAELSRLYAIGVQGQRRRGLGRR